MCCNLRTHVLVISIISLIVTALGSLQIIGSVQAYINNGITWEANFMYGGSMGLTLVMEMLLYSIWIVSQILCIVGATKNNKCLLLPFIIVQGLQIIACVAFTIFFIYSANQSVDTLYNQNYGGEKYVGAVFGVFFYFLIIPLLITLGLTIYFMTIAIQFFKELSSGVVSGQSEGVVLQPYTSPTPVPAGGGFATVYVTPGTQNVPYSYQQQPPTYSDTQQGHGYSTNNPGMKNPV